MKHLQQVVNNKEQVELRYEVNIKHKVLPIVELLMPVKQPAPEGNERRKRAKHKGGVVNEKVVKFRKQKSLRQGRFNFHWSNMLMTEKRTYGA